MNWTPTRRRVATVAVLASLTLIGTLGVQMAARSADTKEQVIKVSTKRSSYSPSEIRLKKGVPVVLELTTEDIMMGFNLPDFKVHGDIVPGKVTQVRLVPDKVGTFVFLCDIFCGAGHEEMSGKIVVVD